MRGTLVVVALCALGGTAAAQVSIPSYTWHKDSWPVSGTQRTLTLPSTMFQASLDTDLTFRGGDNGVNDYDFSPELDYGVTDALTVGLRQTTDVQSQFCAPGAPFCPGGDTHAANFTPHAIYRFLGERDVAAELDLPMAFDGGTEIGADLGVGARIMIGDKLAVRPFLGGQLVRIVHPSGIMQKIGGGVIGSVQVQYQVTDPLALGVSVGAHSVDGGEWDGFVQALYGLHKIDLVAAIGTPDLSPNSNQFVIAFDIRLDF
jgi:hypothetical protein